MDTRAYILLPEVSIQIYEWSQSHCYTDSITVWFIQYSCDILVSHAVLGSLSVIDALLVWRFVCDGMDEDK